MKRSKSEIFRVLHVLEARGYIERAAPSDRYRLTNRMFLTGLRRAPVAELLDVAYPEMRRLSAAIRQSCHISVLSGDRMITVARVEGPGEVNFLLRIGYGVPIQLSASDWVGNSGERPSGPASACRAPLSSRRSHCQTLAMAQQ